MGTGSSFLRGSVLCSRTDMVRPAALVSCLSRGQSQPNNWAPFIDSEPWATLRTRSQMASATDRSSCHVNFHFPQDSNPSSGCSASEGIFPENEHERECFVCLSACLITFWQLNIISVNYSTAFYMGDLAGRESLCDIHPTACQPVVEGRLSRPTCLM